MRRLWPAVLILAGLAFACSESYDEGGVHVIEADGDIGPIMERYLDRALDDAERANAKAAVIELDTPGGLNSSMREIVQRIESADVPVIVYVSPTGGRAASAGTFITMSAHIAAMAPNTSIGAAAAINSDGGDIEGTLGEKIENDAVAFIRGIALLRGRNADWAERAVREAVAVNQAEAVELNVVDFVANDLDDVLRQAEGREVELRPGITATLTGLQNAQRNDVSMTGWERFLEFLANPTVASLLISLGFIGLIIELANPGLIVPGAAGLIAIMLGFLGFEVLPVDTVGLVLIAFGLGLVALELFVPGGIAGGAGVVAILLGGIIAFRDTPSDLRPSLTLVLPLLLTVAFIVGGMIFALAWTKKRETASGLGRLVGQPAVARSEMSPHGYVSVAGERWEADLHGEPYASEGDRLRVVGADGKRLHVRKAEASTQGRLPGSK